MLRTALRYDDGPIALRYPRGEALGVPLPSRAGADRDRHAARSCARATARSRSSATAPASPRAWRPPTCWPSAAWTSTVADARFAKPIDAALMAQLAAEHELLVTVEEGVLAGGFGSAVWETLNERGTARRADPARRPARPLRDARHAGDAARRGRLHRPADRRAHRGRGLRARRRRHVARTSSRSTPRHLPAPAARGARARATPLSGCDGERIDRSGVLQLSPASLIAKQAARSASGAPRRLADRRGRPQRGAARDRSARRLARARHADRGRPRQRAAAAGDRARLGHAGTRSCAAFPTGPTAAGQPIACWRSCSPCCATTGSPIPGAPPDLVGDLSRPYGGPFGSDFGGLGHASHQNGLDVDVYYPRLDRPLQPPGSVADVDRALAQDLVSRFVAAGAQFTFVGLHVGLGGPAGVVQAIAHHDDHVHVRIANVGR